MGKNSEKGRNNYHYRPLSMETENICDQLNELYAILDKKYGSHASQTNLCKILHL